ncbi:MAG: hypothetical protein H0X28_00285 [Solirubrobacterales bacterium]|nr:hypothetical protein [Solirubrobacterales bacterium]
MESHYAAYGLHLTCAFPLLGSEPISPVEHPDLPVLALARITPEELEREWGAVAGSPEWRGRLGDGQDFLIEQGADGEALFVYGNRARFLLHADMRQLDCVPERESLDWQRVLISKVIPAISVMRGYEALHAAAVDSSEGVVAIMAPSGMGKSTLAIEMLNRGWALFADDVLVLQRTADGVLAHPGSPHMNLATGTLRGIDPHTLGESLATLAGEHWLAVGNTTTQPRPVRMLCMLERGAELPTAVSPLAPSPLPLAPYMLGQPGEQERQRDRFSLYADLMEQTALVRLTASLEQEPAVLAELIEGALARQTPIDNGALL